jgi:hypothetical protein
VSPPLFFSNETCFPKILETIKQHLKNHKNTNNSYLDIQYFNKISIVRLVCPRFLEFVFTSDVNDVIILLTSISFLHPMLNYIIILITSNFL